LHGCGYQGGCPKHHRANHCKHFPAGGYRRFAGNQLGLNVVELFSVLSALIDVYPSILERSDSHLVVIQVAPYALHRIFMLSVPLFRARHRFAHIRGCVCHFDCSLSQLVQVLAGFLSVLFERLQD
jgi:hypothetical protein